MCDKGLWIGKWMILALGVLVSCRSPAPPTPAPPQPAPLSFKPGTPIEIVGRVNRMGMVPHQEGLTLAKALEEGGQGFTSFVEKRRIRVYNRGPFPEASYKNKSLLQILDKMLQSGRNDPRVRLRAIVDLEKQPDFVLLPGDLICVPQKVMPTL